MRKFNKTYGHGFSLIEILVAIALVVSVSTIVIAIITSAFRASNKTTSIEIIRQNGNSAMGKITRLIKFADNFAGVSDDGDVFVPSCDTEITYQHIRVKSGGIDKTVSCSDSNISIDGTPVINTGKVRVVGGSCFITCIQDIENIPPIVGINFDLSLADSSQATLPEGSAIVSFSTSVKMRN